MKKNKPIDISPFKHLYPFNSHYMDTDGLKYHFIDEGAGDPVLMIHGNPTWSFYFRELIKALSPKFRTIAVDHIGCGLSDKPDIKKYDYSLKNRIHDIERLIDYLKIKKYINLVVHDWGGIIGMAYALKYPEKINSITIMNTAAFFPPAYKKLPLRLRLIRDLKPFASIAVLGFNLFVYGAVFMASHKGLTKDVKKGLKAPYNSWDNRLATLKFVQDIPVRKNDSSYSIVKYVDENLSKLSSIPVLICWGKHDFVFDISYLEEWQLRFPEAEVRLFADAGHYVLEDEPEQVIKQIKLFLKNLYPD